jgi:hypothetical protein
VTRDYERISEQVLDQLDARTRATHSRLRPEAFVIQLRLDTERSLRASTRWRCEIPHEPDDPGVPCPRCEAVPRDEWWCPERCRDEAGRPVACDHGGTLTDEQRRLFPKSSDIPRTVGGRTARRLDGIEADADRHFEPRRRHRRPRRRPA